MSVDCPPGEPCSDPGNSGELRCRPPALRGTACDPRVSGTCPAGFACIGEPGAATCVGAPGACGDPLDFEALSMPDPASGPEWRAHSSTFDPRVVLEAADCAPPPPDGREVTYRWRAPSTGMFVARTNLPDGLWSIAAYRSCDDRSSAHGCTSSSRLEFPVEVGDPIDVVVRCSMCTDYTLALAVLPTRQLDEVCDPDRLADVCAPPLVCEPLSSTCQEL